MGIVKINKEEWEEETLEESALQGLWCSVHLQESIPTEAWDENHPSLSIYLYINQR